MSSSLNGCSSLSSKCSSSSSSKRVTWGKNSTFKDPVFLAAQRKVHFTLDSLKRKIRRSGSGDDSKHMFKRRVTTSHKKLRGILKSPTNQFPGHYLDLGFDWSGFAEDFSAHADADIHPPGLPTLTDTEDTPISSAVSTPPGTSFAYDQWETGSDYFSDQWETTPRLPSSGWSSPPLCDKIISPAGLPVPSQPFQFNETIPAITHTANAFEERTQILEEPVQTPQAFLDDLASSLQYTLVVCGIGLMLLSFLFIWTTLLLTCGILMAFVAPAVLVAYWIIYLVTSTKYSAEWIVLTTIKIGGGLGLGIGFALVLIIEYVVDEIESLCILTINSLLLLFLIGSSITTLCLLLGSNPHDSIAHGIGFLLSF
jgi:hypothetical protein